MHARDPEDTAHRAGVPIHTVTLPGQLAGCTDGHQVWVDHRLTLVERRCTIGHELVHVWAGHTGHQPPEVESWVRRHTAHLLLRGCDVRGALRSEPTLWDAAESLGVTVPVLLDQLHSHIGPTGPTTSGGSSWNC